MWNSSIRIHVLILNALFFTIIGGQQYDFAAEISRQCLVPDPVGLLDCVEAKVDLPYMASWVECTNSLGQNVATTSDIINYRCKSVWEGKGVIPEVFYIKDCVIEKIGLPAPNVSKIILGSYKECESSPTSSSVKKTQQASPTGLTEQKPQTIAAPVAIQPPVVKNPSSKQYFGIFPPPTVMNSAAKDQASQMFGQQPIHQQQLPDTQVTSRQQNVNGQFGQRLQSQSPSNQNSGGKPLQQQNFNQQQPVYTQHVNQQPVFQQQMLNKQPHFPLQFNQQPVIQQQQFNQRPVLQQQKFNQQPALKQQQFIQQPALQQQQFIQQPAFQQQQFMQQPAFQQQQFIQQPAFQQQQFIQQPIYNSQQAHQQHMGQSPISQQRLMQPVFKQQPKQAAYQQQPISKTQHNVQQFTQQRQINSQLFDQSPASKQYAQSPNTQQMQLPINLGQDAGNSNIKLFFNPNSGGYYHEYTSSHQSKKTSG